jgi:hypothetical protein
MRVLYSFNKRGKEADIWAEEIANSSSRHCVYIPFNHDPYLQTKSYLRAQLLDELYYQKHFKLMQLYRDIEVIIQDQKIDVMIVDTCNPYHPDYLRKLPIYKVLRIADGPISAYDRDFAYVHAFDQVLYHSRAYSEELDMPEKLSYCRVRKADFWPLAVFDASRNLKLNPSLISKEIRDIDIVFVGSMHLGKMQLLAKIKQKFRRNLRMYGQTNLKRNLYFNFRFGFPGWIQPIPTDKYVQLYGQSKIGFNVHNRGKYTVGSYRLFELPANGVMQISDGGEYLSDFYELGTEIISYENVNDLSEKIEFYLDHPEERLRIAIAAFERTLRDHTMQVRMEQLTSLLQAGMRA